MFEHYEPETAVHPDCMKDRNSTYHTSVYFTDAQKQKVNLNGKKQVIIYGIP